MGKITDYSRITTLTGDEVILLVQNGVTMKATLKDIQMGEPDAKGIYPDVPMNYVEIVRYSAQTSTTVVLNGNLDMVTQIAATAFPCTIDRNSLVTSYLNGNDVRKTADGLPSVLDDWTQPAMVRMGGIWVKYWYDSSTNTKHWRLSTKKVRGYRYKRRRYLNMYGGCVETHEEKSMLLSNSGKWTTQSKTLSAYHTAAKNLGSNFREIATQDRELYRLYFWLMEKTFNSQSKIRGICDVSWDWWGKFSQAGNGGQSSLAQFYQTGITNEVSGHKGETSVTVNNGSSDVTVKPYKWLWREGMLSGPYWIREIGYLKKAGKWYKANNINTVTSFDPTSDQYTYLCDECTQAGYILEDFKDTLIVSQTGGSDSTGHADNYRRADDAAGNNVYIPAGVGSANDGSYLGVSVLNSNHGVSASNPHFGGALASDDPTDPTAENTIAS